MKIFIALFLISVAGASAEVFTSSIVSAEATMPVQHGSSVVQLDDGSILVSWYAGTAEAARDSRIFVRRSSAANENWEPTQIAVAPEERAAESWFANKSLGNTVLFQDAENLVWLFYGVVEFGGWSAAHVDYKTSRDRGCTWSPSHRLTSGLGDLPRSKPITISATEILLPLSHSAIRKYAFGARLTIGGGIVQRLLFSKINGAQNSHPALVRSKAGSVLAILRARGGGMLRSTTFDLVANTWAEPRATNLANPDSPADAVMLDDGRILLVYNESKTARNPLSLALSDDGLEFRKVRDVENEVGSEFSYPALIRARDGSFYLTYTWHHRSAIKCVHFDASWLGTSILAAR